MLMVDIRGIEI